jgi:hypothetical protein
MQDIRSSGVAYGVSTRAGTGVTPQTIMHEAVRTLTDVKVFLSWSGDVSRQVAGLLREWLPLVINEIEPFMSSEDIDKGTRGLNIIASELQDSDHGVVVVTEENFERPWINFEAGALSKVVEGSRVTPLLRS